MLPPSLSSAVDEAESMFMKELEKKLAEQQEMTRREFTAKLNEQVRNL